MNAGYEMHLAKPVDLDELRRGVATLVAQHAPRVARTQRRV
jgi:hypothetical protein